MTFPSIFIGQNPSSFMTQFKCHFSQLALCTQEHHRLGDLHEEIPALWPEGCQSRSCASRSRIWRGTGLQMTAFLLCTHSAFPYSVLLGGKREREGKRLKGRERERTVWGTEGWGAEGERELSLLLQVLRAPIPLQGSGLLHDPLTPNLSS